MPLPRVKITGSRGSWTADVDGRRLAVLHATYMPQGKETRYIDPFIGESRNTADYAALMERLRTENAVVIQKDKDPRTMTRDGYVGVFAFEDLRVEADGSFSLRLTERIADPKR